ncbi:hypothetical protein KWI_0120640 [Xanthomonas vasicola pv. vasculorum NCPPB 206]|nr:hypothetical protein KWI_0120640 [Xanthomonas vasicola pv. vasculorum NCPPB 206]
MPRHRGAVGIGAHGQENHDECRHDDGGAGKHPCPHGLRQGDAAQPTVAACLQHFLAEQGHGAFP